jgi:hypothetical protein
MRLHMNYHTALKAIPAKQLPGDRFGPGIRLCPTQTQMSLLRVERILLAHEASIPHISIELRKLLGWIMANVDSHN